jgi:secreted PhoX family phosphatase
MVLLALNHEYIDNGMLFTDGMANWNLDKARKGQNAMGVSVVEVKKRAATGRWFARLLMPAVSPSIRRCSLPARRGIRT